ncbi:MAG: hypothetical protein ACI4V5_05545 [Prevotella sp.]
MRFTVKKIVTLIVISTVFAACIDNRRHTEAEQLLDKARQYYSDKQYDKALKSIDSLRREFSSEIELRKVALELYKDVELAKAEKALQKVDSELKQAEEYYSLMLKNVEKRRKEGNITYDELLAKTKAKSRMDSLRTAFDTECAKIRLIKIKKGEAK